MIFTRNATTAGIKIYEVGGKIRDEFLNLKNNDSDFAVIAPSFAAMREFIVLNGGEIFLETEQYLTIRAKMPELGAADFVLGRTDGAYRDGRRPESVNVCSTIEQELGRRDFTVNAMARDCETGELIDPFNGQADIANKTIRCVGDARQRFMEDRLRVLRAIRFSITKGFTLQMDTRAAISEFSDLRGVSVERVREELLKCFECNTIATLQALDEFPLLKLTCFSGKLFLKPTIKP